MTPWQSWETIGLVCLAALLFAHTVNEVIGYFNLSRLSRVFVQNESQLDPANLKAPAELKPLWPFGFLDEWPLIETESAERARLEFPLNVVSLDRYRRQRWECN